MSARCEDLSRLARRHGAGRSRLARRATTGLAGTVLLGAAACLLLVAAACGGAKPRSKDSAPAIERFETCPVADGSVRLMVPRPPRHAVARVPGGCMVAEEEGEVPLFVSATAVERASPRAEPLSDGPDGLVSFVEEAGLLGAPLQRIGTAPVSVDERRRTAVRVIGSLPGGIRREASLVEVPRGRYHVLLMAVYKPGDEDERARAHRLLRAVRFE